MPKQPEFIVVEGPIGVGKTSLAMRLAETFKSATLLEDAESNPFLDRFYADPIAAALPTQLHFLFQRSRQLSEYKQGDLFRNALVADFLFEKDHLFAEVNLDQHEYALYEKVYSQLVMTAPSPDLVVYLQAPADVLMQRINMRARTQERKLEINYLRRLCDAYTNFFYRYNDAPLLIVNASDINPVDNDSDYQLLIDKICNSASGKNYFNPPPLDLR